MSRAPVPKWTGTVDADGKLRVDARELFLKHLQRLKNSSIELVIRKASRQKSQGQLGYLFGIVYPVIAEDLGYREYEVDEVHDAVVREIRGLKPEPNPLKLRWSLREQDHEETSRYIEDVRHWALMKYAIVTPDAGAMEGRAHGD